MKKITLILGVFVIIACSKDGEMNDREFITTCYKFVEKGSDQPIVGLNLLINYGNNNLLGTQGATNDEGIWCFDHWNDEGPLATPYLFPQYYDLYYSFPSKLPMNGSLNIIELSLK